MRFLNGMNFRVSCFRFVALFLLCFFSQIMSASHIVGGEINYRCLGDDRYEIVMTVYRDCFYGNPLVWFDNPASIGIFDRNNRLRYDLRMRLMNNDTLQPVLSGECYVAPPSVCVHTTRYRDTVTLPFLEGGYQLAYQRCCRNETIQNIIDPANTGATFYAFISEESLRSCNSNAVFRTWPPIYICVGEPIYFDHSAADIDGDSLVYRLCTPLTGATPDSPTPRPPNPPPYVPLRWLSPFGEHDMLGGDPLRIDSRTGLLTGLPRITGQFVAGICVEEYRDGVLISATRRDFQYNIGLCGKTESAFFSPEVNCGFDVYFENLSQTADSVLWIIDDPANPGFTSSDYHLQYTFSGPGQYIVTLIANPGAPCADTSMRSIEIVPLSMSGEIGISQLYCSDSLRLRLDADVRDSEYQITSLEWELSDGTDTYSFTGNPAEVSVPLAPVVTVTMIAVNSKGCRLVITDEYRPDLVSLDFGSRLYTVCDDIPVSINAVLNPPGASVTWSPDSWILSGQGTADPLVLAPESGYISVRIMSPGGCELADSVFVSVPDPLPAFDARAVPDTIVIGGVSQLSVRPSDTVFTYQWNNAGSLSSAVIPDPEASPLATTDYTVTVTGEGGCTRELTVRVVVTILPCDDSYVYIPSAFSPNNDPYNNTFNVRSSVLGPFTLIVYNRWGEKLFETNDAGRGWDGTFEGEPVPIDAYGYYFEGVCLDGTPIRLKGNVSLLR